MDLGGSQAGKERYQGESQLPAGVSVLDGLRVGESTGWPREPWRYQQFKWAKKGTLEDWTKQMVEFQQEPGNWDLTFGIATSGVLSLGMKLEPEHAHSALWVEFKELLK